MKSLLDQFGLGNEVPLPDLGGMPLPGYTVEGRIGGFVLPFDVGLKFGILPLPLGDTKLNYLLAGGEIRYAVLKNSVALPTVSVGLGLNYLSGGIEQSIGQGYSFSYIDGNQASQTLNLAAPKVGLEWQTTALDLKAQISKSFLIITPYAGLGLSHAWSKAGYRIKADITDTSGDIDKAIDALKHYGIADLSEKGFSSIYDVTGWSCRIFGGLSVNLTVFRFDLTALYNFMDSNYGVSLGTRFQL